eukprot:TRINITY_DN66858_c0_g1_i1.p1 TRINITY_DN66858_c0_g1~~TRINITY_DN66858_c0_g1_i1.p1  ORF type:complete len:458 (+),score=48.35 TRINITY_DN66858_c0_g1_i1:68-1375(+)
MATCTSSRCHVSFDDENGVLSQSGLPSAEAVEFMENASMSLHWVGPDGTILWANREELSMLGYEPEEYIGKRIDQFHCDEHVINDILVRLTRFERIKNYPARLKHADGSIVYVEISSSVYCDSKGNFKHTRCFTSNVTARVLAQELLEKQKALAQIKELSIYNLRLERRTRQLKREQDCKMRLLQKILPEKVCRPLLVGEYVPPELFPEVTVFFSDIVGFTEIAGGVPPSQVVHLLNQLYTIMDLCASKVGIYKVETIGDGYVGVSGLPHPNSQHAEAIADFALLVQSVASVVPNPLRPDEPIQLRLGIHSGPVVAGVVGTLMPRYGLFGDTVNVASRMESTSLNGKIQCSENAFAHLAQADRFELELRGSIDVKGKGSMQTYWLHSTKCTENSIACPDSVAAMKAKARILLDELPIKHNFSSWLQNADLVSETV